MNICMMVSTDMSHDARVWKEARTLAAHGHEVTVLAAYREGLPAEEVEGRVRVVRVIPPPWRKHPTGAAHAVEPTSGHAAEANAKHAAVPAPQKTPSLLRRLLAPFVGWLWGVRVFLTAIRTAARLRPDVIHVHDADRLFVGGLTSILLRRPLVYDSHEYFAGLVIARGLRWTLARWWYIAMEYLFVPRAEAVVTVSGPIAQQLRRRYGVRDLVVLHNYPSRPPAPTGGERLRALLAEHHQGRPILLWQGRMVPDRGVEPFLEVLARVPEAVGVVVGGGPCEAAMKEYARQLGLGERVVFVPQVPWTELAEYTPAADLGFYLQPGTCESWRLTMPNKVFEYLMAGVPVVASDMPGVREVVEKEEVGVAVPLGDPAHIADLVRDLLSGPSRLAAMKQNALRAAQVKFNWERQEELLAGLYQRLESRPSKASSRQQV